jgi:hypothetical protein
MVAGVGLSKRPIKLIAVWVCLLRVALNGFSEEPFTAAFRLNPKIRRYHPRHGAISGFQPATAAANLFTQATGVDAIVRAYVRKRTSP